MKYLRRYSTLNDYISDFLDLKSLPAYVSLVDDTDSMIGKDSQKKTVFVKYKTTDAWVGDLLCWNKSTEDWEVLHVLHTYKGLGKKDNNKFDNWDDNLVPDGVCVVPACHTDNGKARWLALTNFLSVICNTIVSNMEINNMNYYTLIPLTAVTYVEDESNEKYYITLHNKFSGDGITTSNYANIGCEIGFLTDYVNAANVYMFQSETTSYRYEVMHNQLKDPVEGNKLSIKFCDFGDMPVTLNVYGQTEDNYLLLKNTQVFKYKNSSGELNPICDINGRKNTDILIANGILNFPAAEACNNYHTTYTNPGDWYLPALGEFAYLLSRWYTINQTLYMLYNTTATKNYTSGVLNNFCNYCSSTWYNSSSAYTINSAQSMINLSSGSSTGYIIRMRLF